MEENEQNRKKFEIPNSNYVLKLAYNYKGLIQNKNEYNFYFDCDKNPILAKCFEKGKNYNWLIYTLFNVYKSKKKTI